MAEKKVMFFSDRETFIVQSIIKKIQQEELYMKLLFLNLKKIILKKKIIRRQLDNGFLN